MRHIDEYRDGATATRLLTEIRRAATRPRTVMEVCGGQTHGLLAAGIDEQLLGTVELIHGPGCPVCVTPAEDIDLAIALAERPQTVVATFGDMLRVPGTRESLSAARGRGGQVQVVYSPLQAVALAQQDPQRQVVLFAVGFETTAPATALAVLQARQLGLANFSLLCSHVRVQPAMERIASDPLCRVEGFLAAGHVCVVDGYDSYAQFAQRFHVPVVVTGFELIDLLAGILTCVQSIEAGRHEVANCYTRNARPLGNPVAQAAIEQVYQIADRPWRGLGTIDLGGLTLRPAWQRFDARVRFGEAVTLPLPLCLDQVTPRCRSAEVLLGQIKPPECEAFGRACTPSTPSGAPMVSAEGACAAYFQRHGRDVPNAAEDKNELKSL